MTGQKQRWNLIDGCLLHRLDLIGDELVDSDQEKRALRAKQVHFDPEQVLLRGDPQRLLGPLWWLFALGCDRPLQFERLRYQCVERFSHLTDWPHLEHCLVEQLA